jgi:hypothetical protein
VDNEGSIPVGDTDATTRRPGLESASYSSRRGGFLPGTRSVRTGVL